MIYFKRGWLAFSRRTDLTLSAKLVFQIIVGYSQNHWKCNLRIKDFAEMNGISFHTAQDAVALLIKSEWVSRNKKGHLVLTAKTRLIIRAETKKAKDIKENIGADSDSTDETIRAETDSMTISESDSTQGQNLIVTYNNSKDTITNDAKASVCNKNISASISSGSKYFKKPTPAEVTEYAKSIDYQLDGDAFCDYYESKGWLIGKTPMKSWRAAVRTWKRKNKEAEPPDESYEPTDEQLDKILQDAGKL